MVEEHEPPIRRWFTSFALLHATMLSASIILAASTDSEGTRNEMIVGSISSTLALASLTIFSPPLLGAGDRLRGMTYDTPEARLRKMREAEDIVRRASDAVDFLHSWFPSTASLVYVGGASLTLLLAFDRPTGAFTHIIGGTILGLGRVLLHPTGSRTAWRRYARAYADAGCEVRDEPIARLPAPTLQVHPHGAGLGLTVRF